jgi:hypothetical protein
MGKTHGSVICRRHFLQELGFLLVNKVGCTFAPDDPPNAPPCTRRLSYWK